MILKQFPRGEKEAAAKRVKISVIAIFSLAVSRRKLYNARVPRAERLAARAKAFAQKIKRGFYDERKVFFQEFIEAGGPHERQPVESSAFIRRAHHALVFSATDLRFDRRDNLRAGSFRRTGGGR